MEGPREKRATKRDKARERINDELHLVRMVRVVLLQQTYVKMILDYCRYLTF